MRTASLFAVLGISVLGCSEYDIKSDSDIQDVDNGGKAPDIEVDPTEVNFGSLAVADADEVTEVVDVSNVGDADLHIQDMYLEDPDGPFSFGAISSVLIQPGGAAEFTVTFVPETANLISTNVIVESDDPDEPAVPVLLTGEGIAPVIDLDPEEYDFGTLYLGCEGLQPITITNIGNDDLVVSSFEYNTGSSDLAFDDATDLNGALPWTLAPTEQLEVYVSYYPTDEFGDVAYLMVDSNDPYTPTAMAVQEGLGSIYGTNLDIFEQPIQGSTDIIFAVDRSGSMSDDIANVQTNFDSFVDTLASLDADYRVAATVEDNGCINGSDLYIDNTFSADDAKDTITTMINLGASYGSNTERAFMLLESCLSEIGSGGCNEDLVRDEAKLNLVGVSDEPEQSVNNYSYYVSLFQSLKSNPDDLVIHAIGGDYPSGCGSASAYTGMYEATVATGGLFLSICATDWGDQLETLAEGSTSVNDSFELTDWPVPETIVVRVDGVNQTIGWSYNGADNSVDFEAEYIPEGGSTIEVDYALYGDCDQ